MTDSPHCAMNNVAASSYTTSDTNEGLLGDMGTVENH